MSEQLAEQSSGEVGIVGAGTAVPAFSDMPKDTAAVTKLVAAIASAQIAPDHEAPKEDPPKADLLKIDLPKLDMSKADMSKADALKFEAPKSEQPRPDLAKPDLAKSDLAKSDLVKSDPVKSDLVKPATANFAPPRPEMPKSEAFKPGAPRSARRPEPPRIPREPVVMSAPGERSWSSRTAEPKAESRPDAAALDKRRFATMAAIVALAVLAGAVGGALATVGATQFAGAGAATSPNTALEASIARIDADVVTLKAGLEQASRYSLSQFNKANDRLDRIEKAQAEPAAKLAKLSEAVDKLHVAPMVAGAAPAGAREITGSVTPPAGSAAAQPAAAAAATSPKSDTPKAEARTDSAKPEVGRLPTVEGWVLRDIGHGSALIEGRRGLYEVYAGDPVPGLGRIDAIRRQDGRWVVVTTKGLIVAR